MSAYANFYLKSKSGEMVPFGSYSRSTRIYNMVADSPWEKLRAISEQKFKNIDRALVDNLEDIRQHINRYSERKKAIISFNNSIEEKQDALDEIDEIIEEFKETIEEINRARIFFQMLADAADDVKYLDGYDCNKYVYCGIEAFSDSEIEE